MVSKEEYIRKKEAVSEWEKACRDDLEQLDKVLKELASGQEELEQTDGMAVLSGAESLTKELVDSEKG